METDRELLELAAKAAGIEIQAACDSTCCIDVGKREPVYWNPLTDDGDALRLAVKLDIHITNGKTYAWASSVKTDATEHLGADPYAATRRAIVRAAAEIGRSLACR